MTAAVGDRLLRLPLLFFRLGLGFRLRFRCGSLCRMSGWLLRLWRRPLLPGCRSGPGLRSRMLPFRLRLSPDGRPRSCLRSRLWLFLRLGAWGRSRARFRRWALSRLARFRARGSLRCGVRLWVAGPRGSALGSRLVGRRMIWRSDRFCLHYSAPAELGWALGCRHRRPALVGAGPHLRIGTRHLNALRLLPRCL